MANEEFGDEIWIHPEPPMTDEPDGKRWEQPGRSIVSLIAILALAGAVIAFWWANRGPQVVGAWKGTDASGHEHYFEFRKDGSLVYWDRERQHDGTFNERPHFWGSYNTIDPNTVSATDAGWPADPLGRFTLVTLDRLEQEGGHSVRDHLVYERVAIK
jgi:hypothetical protein